MSKWDEAQAGRIVDYAKTELSHCEASIARYDSLAFQIRTWTITLSGALFAAATSTHQSEILWVAAGATLLLWTIEGRIKSSQYIMLRRSNELQQGILAFLRTGTFPEDFLGKPNLGALQEHDAMLPNHVSYQRTVAAMKHGDVASFYALVFAIAVAFALVLLAFVEKEVSAEKNITPPQCCLQAVPPKAKPARP